ncbi:MAG: type IV secretion system protein [Pseudobutyrivibrio sp.]|nr:type IV secretion system protein [Pseudobutyrivibrio sp.]
MNILYRVMMICGPVQPVNPPAGYNGLTGSVQGNGSNATTVDSISLLERLYRLAFDVFNNLIKAMEFPRLTESDGKWVNLWNAAKGCFDIMFGVAIPIASIFFMIAIYKTVVGKPPEEQPKQFVVDTLRYAFIIVIVSNLFNYLTLIINITDEVTNTLLEIKEMDPTSTDDEIKYKDYDVRYDESPIKKVVDRYSITDKEKHSITSYEDKSVLDFFCDLFEYIILFFGGLATIIIFGVAGYTIVKTTIERIIKPLAMLPFSVIVIGMGVCSGDGERSVVNFIKKLLAFCLSGVFIIMAVKIGSLVARMSLFDLTNKLKISETNILAAIAGIFNVNLPVILTTGLVRSSENFMDKVFA